AGILDPNFPACNRRRHLVTTRSHDLDTVGLTPFVWDPNDATTLYQLATPGKYPIGGTIPYPLNNGKTPDNMAHGDFGADWRAVYAARAKVDLSRPLTRYPDPAGGSITPGDPVFATAQSDRQKLAADIFTRLRVATGAKDPTAATPGGADYDALRWLAQLAVNI